MEIDYKVIGDRIREIRKSKKLTQEKLSELAEIEPSNMSHIERAATKVSLPTLVKICNALGVTLDEVVYTNLEKSSHISVKIIDEIISDCTADELDAISEIIKTMKKVMRSKK